MFTRNQITIPKAPARKASRRFFFMFGFVEEAVEADESNPPSTTHLPVAHQVVPELPAGPGLRKASDANVVPFRFKRAAGGR